jgi:RNA polymerase sigma factor (sigma-70 family)
MAAVATNHDLSPAADEAPGEGLHAALLAHHQQFLRFVRRRLNDPELAAEVVQDSYLKAIKQAGALRDQERAVAWFYRILRQTLTDVYRRRAVRQRVVAAWPENFDAIAESEEQQAICACLAALLPSLKPGEAQLVQSLDLNQEDPEQIAKRLHLSANALRVRHHRARQHLRERLLQVCRMCAAHGCLDCHCQQPPAGEQKNS